MGPQGPRPGKGIPPSIFKSEAQQVNNIRLAIDSIQKRRGLLVQEAEGYVRVLNGLDIIASAANEYLNRLGSSSPDASTWFAALGECRIGWTAILSARQSYCQREIEVIDGEIVSSKHFSHNYNHRLQGYNS